MLTGKTIGKYTQRETEVFITCLISEGIGNFTYYMDMYEDENNNVTVTQFPKEVGLGQKMYYGFRVESGDTDLVVFPDVCKATASPNFDSTPDHVIIDKA